MTVISSPRKGYCGTCGAGAKQERGDQEQEEQGGFPGEQGEEQGDEQGEGQGGSPPPFIDEDSETSCGGGSGSGGDPLEDEEEGPGEDGIGEEESKAIKDQIAKDILEHSEKSRGSVPGGLVDWATSHMDNTIDWQKEMRKYISRSINRSLGTLEQTWRRPSRRTNMAAKNRIYMPGFEDPELSVAVVVDTSGSMSEDDLAQAVGEIHGILKSQSISENRVTVLTVSTDVAACKKVSKASQVMELDKEGGGTDMRVGIKHAAELDDKPQLIILLSDGYTPYPDKPVKGTEIVVGVIGAEERGDDLKSRFGIPHFINSIPIPHSDK